MQVGDRKREINVGISWLIIFIFFVLYCYHFKEFIERVKNILVVWVPDETDFFFVITESALRWTPQSPDSVIVRVTYSYTSGAHLTWRPVKLVRTFLHVVCSLVVSGGLVFPLSFFRVLPRLSCDD